MLATFQGEAHFSYTMGVAQGSGSSAGTLRNGRFTRVKASGVTRLFSTQKSTDANHASAGRFTLGNKKAITLK